MAVLTDIIFIDNIFAAITVISGLYAIRTLATVFYGVACHIAVVWICNSTAKLVLLADVVNADVPNIVQYIICDL